MQNVPINNLKNKQRHQYFQGASQREIEEQDNS